MTGLSSRRRLGASGVGRTPHPRRALLAMLVASGVAALLVIAAVAAGPGPARAQGGTADEAHARLTGLAASARGAEGPSGLSAAADAIERADGVVLAADGRPVGLGFLSADIQAMRSGDPQAARAAAARAAKRLDALAAELPETALAAAGPDKARLAEVLSHRDFKGADPFVRAFARFVEAVQEWQRRNLGLSYAGEGGPTARIPTGALAALAGLAVILAGSIVVASLRRGRTAGAGRRPMGVRAAAGQGPGPPGSSPEDAERKAAILAQKGELDEAVRALFASVPGRLQRAGLVPGRREITDRDMLAAVRAARGPAAEPLSDLVEVFERSFYGGRPVDQASWARFRARFSELVRAVESAGSPAPDAVVS